MSGNTFKDPPHAPVRPRPRARLRGFSMIELLVVAAIVAAVAAMLLVVMGKVYEVIRSWN
jgi:prepilin-type N-terminal cleavage/methylation domain-containing protein